MASIRRRGNTWYYTVDVGKDPITNKRKQKTVGGFKTEKEALREALKVEEKVEKGKRIGAPKYSEFIRDYMQEVKHQVTASTFHNQNSFAEKYIIPFLGNKTMDKIKYDDIQKFYDHLIDKGIHPGMIKNIALVLRKSFRQALRKELIYHNPAQYVKPPRYTPTTMKVWNQSQVQTFLDWAKDNSPYYQIYALAVTTGMRVGEILGLFWDDINFDLQTLTIQRSAKYEGGKLYTKETKNKSSRRTIALTESTVKMLQEHKENSLPYFLVFHRFNEMLYPTTISRQFAFDCVTAGVPKIRFHDMRHTHATMLLQMGVNPKIVAERLGHSTIKTTLDTYSHVLPNMQKEVADMLNSKFDL